MHSPATYLIRLLIFLVIIIALDLYAFQAVKAISVTSPFKLYWKFSYWGINLAFYAYLIFTIASAGFGANFAPANFHWMATIMLLLYLPKIVLIAILLGEDIFRATKWIVKNMGVLFSSPESSPKSDAITMSRSEFVSKAALIAAAIPFLALGWGIINGRYKFTVKRVRLALKNLPSQFRGFRIVQISDLHTGSFGNKDEVRRGMEMVNSENPDMIFFTGDLVNNEVNELAGYKEIYSLLSAPHGVFSIIGNHDYGDYVRWPSSEAKAANFKAICDIQAEFGWQLLLNQNKIIEKDGAKLAVIGVENWSARNFTTTGDLVKAYQGAEGADIKLLLSHDPTHWDSEVRPKYPDIAATFSGHTHGAQMGIDIPGFRWSPAQWVYKQWSGLYREGDQSLYVNQGLGYIGYMGRLGILPEITVFELEAAPVS